MHERVAWQNPSSQLNAHNTHAIILVYMDISFLDVRVLNDHELSLRISRNVACLTWVTWPIWYTQFTQLCLSSFNLVTLVLARLSSEHTFASYAHQCHNVDCYLWIAQGATEMPQTTRLRLLPLKYVCNYASCTKYTINMSHYPRHDKTHKTRCITAYALHNTLHMCLLICMYTHVQVSFVLPYN